MTAARSRSARPTKRYASSLGRRPKTSKRSHGATRHYQHRVRASARGSAFARFLAVPILPGFDSRGLRPGARATRAVDAASRARRRRLEGEPRLRGLSGRARSVEGSTRVIDTWSHLADREGCLRATEVDTQHKEQIADLLPHHLESKTMHELSKLTRQHYEKNEAGASLLSKVTTMNTTSCPRAFSLRAMLVIRLRWPGTEHLNAILINCHR